MAKTLQEKIKNRSAVIGVIGLGYIGLSLLDAFGKAGFPLRGYDVDPLRIEQLYRKESPYNYMNIDILFEMLNKGSFKISSDSAVIKDADVMIICVSTSLDQYQIPDFRSLRSAFSIVHKYIGKDKLVILQSSTAPGTTEDELYPLLKDKKLKVGEDYYLAHVPEIADPGNSKFSFSDVPRIVSGMTKKCLDVVSSLYTAIGCQVVQASSPRIAESAKLVQNAFRLINISFVNELKMMFDNMGIDVWEVIDVASSKPFGYMPFKPGPGIGGDCIPTDPFYLIWESRFTHGPTSLIEQAGRINDTMPSYVVSKIISALNTQNKSIAGAKILVLGVTYKKDTNATQASASLPIIANLKKMRADVSFHDPYVEELVDMPQAGHFGMRSVYWNPENLKKYDAVLIAVDHSFYDWKVVTNKSRLIVDTRNVCENIPGKVFKA